MNTDYTDNELPVVVFRDPVQSDRRAAKPGLSALLKAMQVGEVKELGDFKQSAVPATCRSLGIKAQTAKGTDGKIYVRRIK